MTTTELTGRKKRADERVRSDAALATLADEAAARWSLIRIDAPFVSPLTRARAGAAPTGVFSKSSSKVNGGGGGGGGGSGRRGQFA